MKVLVVDDDDDSRLMLHELLSKQGYEVLDAVNGQFALEQVREHRPQLVISDIQMPVMDGFQLCREIKSDKVLNAIVFVVYTGVFDHPEDERLMMDLGASLFISKPADPQEFLRKIQPVVDKLPELTPSQPEQQPDPKNNIDKRHSERLTALLDKKIRELNASQRIFQTLTSNLPGIAYRFRNNPERTIKFVSAAYKEVTGHSCDTAMSSEASFSQLVHKADRDQVWRELQAATQERRPFELEYRINRRDGSVRWFWEQGVCVNPGKDSEMLEGYITDITDRREAMMDRNRFFNLSLDLLCIAGLDGYFKQLNPSWTKTLGWSEEEILARPWIDLVHPDDRENTEQTRTDLGTGQEVVSFENRFLAKDGTYRWLRWSSMPLPEEGLLYGVAHDITDRVNNELKLKQLNRALRTISSGNHALVHMESESDLLSQMCRVAVEAGDYPCALVGYLGQGDQPQIVLKAHASQDSELSRGISTAWDAHQVYQGSFAKAIETSETQLVENPANDPSMARWPAVAEQHCVESAIVLPLCVHSKAPQGVLVILGNQADGFMDEEVAILEEMASDLAFGIAALRLQGEKSQAESLLEESLLKTVEAIARTVEKRDPYTSGHQHRVAQLATAIASEMGLDDSRVRGLDLGASIHDIGKVSVPAEILNRPGRLSDNEFEIIKSHPEVGYDIIKEIRFPWPIAEMIYQHHERLDGSGYPRGLKDDEILLEARIMAVADVVEAISSHRPYRPALGIEVALETVEEKKGLWFDTQVVEACKRLINDKGFQFK